MNEGKDGSIFIGKKLVNPASIVSNTDSCEINSPENSGTGAENAHSNP